MNSAEERLNGIRARTVRTSKPGQHLPSYTSLPTSTGINISVCPILLYVWGLAVQKQASEEIVCLAFVVPNPEKPKFGGYCACYGRNRLRSSWVGLPDGQLCSDDV